MQVPWVNSEKTSKLVFSIITKKLKGGKKREYMENISRLFGKCCKNDLDDI